MEVVHLGNQTPQQIARVAAEGDVGVVGLSVLAAGHNRLITGTVRALADEKVDDALLVVGGIIPRADIPLPKQTVVDEVFGPGTPMETIVDCSRRHAPGKWTAVRTARRPDPRGHEPMQEACEGP